MEREERSEAKPGAGLLIAGIAVGALAVLGCGGVVGAVAFLMHFRGGGGAKAPEIVDIFGRWEVDQISKLILDFRPDGTGTVEIPEARVRIPITFKLVDDELTITAAQPQALGIGEPDVIDRLGRTRVQRTGNELRLDAIAGPAQGQAIILKKIG